MAASLADSYFLQSKQVMTGLCRLPKTSLLDSKQSSANSSQFRSNFCPLYQQPVSLIFDDVEVEGAGLALFASIVTVDEPKLAASTSSTYSSALSVDVEGPCILTSSSVVFLLLPLPKI